MVTKWNIPIKSATVLPFVNLPVLLLTKLKPYGKKFALATVGNKLLLPLSNNESPKTYRAGASWVALLINGRKNNENITELLLKMVIMFLLFGKEEN